MYVRDYFKLILVYLCQKRSVRLILQLKLTGQNELLVEPNFTEIEINTNTVTNTQAQITSFEICFVV